jgi:hypothetical protein
MVNRRYSLTAGLALMLLAQFIAGCSSSTSSDDNGGGGSTDLTVSDATPTSGNGGVTNIQVTVDTAAAVAQGPSVHLTVTGEVGTIKHVFNFDILKSDQSMPNFEHAWGTDLLNPEGFTLCDAGGMVGSPCASAQFTPDLAGKSITFTGLVLTSALGDGDASTVTGALAY